MNERDAYQLARAFAEVFASRRRGYEYACVSVEAAIETAKALGGSKVTVYRLCRRRLLRPSLSFQTPRFFPLLKSRDFCRKARAQLHRVEEGGEGGSV